MSPIAKEEWLDRAATHYVEKARIEPAIATAIAADLYDVVDLADYESPEEAVDEDLTYWGDL
ncbi:MAG: hypothetical protein M0T84_15610 [Betaproteobacteria bacterium]|nr:hypothetical protein [Betaproteobacteria bacterium]